MIIEKCSYKNTIDSQTFVFVIISFVIFAGSCSYPTPQKKKQDSTEYTTRDNLKLYQDDYATIAIPNHPINSSQRRHLSLRNFIDKAISYPKDEEVKNLFGLGWIEGYVIDNENNDVILFGRESNEWPSLTIYDLITNLENVIRNETYPYCSLDPVPENVLAFNKGLKEMDFSMPYANYFNKLSSLWGPQKVVVGGVPNTSHHALVMLEADYHMKKVSQGHVKISPLISLLDKSFIESLNKLISEKSAMDKPTSNLSRFWFHIKPENHPLFQYAEGIVVIDSCDVVLLTEAQKSRADGTLYDSGDENPKARLFAFEFTKYFKSSAKQVSYYAQLDNLFRLQAILRAMIFKGHFAEYSAMFMKLVDNYPSKLTYDIPDYYNGLVNVKEASYSYLKDESLKTQKIINLVCGGVSMEMELTGKNFKLNKVSLTKNLYENIINQYSSKRISWVSEI